MGYYHICAPYLHSVLATQIKIITIGLIGKIVAVYAVGCGFDSLRSRTYLYCASGAEVDCSSKGGG